MNNFQQYLLDEFSDDYKVGRLGRRDFILKVVGVCGGVAAASHVFASVGLTSADIAAAYAEAPSAPLQQTDAITVSPNDPDVVASTVQFLSTDGSRLTGYLAQPSAAGAYPGVVIIHENRGLLEHFRDLARRYAKEGFAAIVPDLVSREGGTDRLDPNEIPGILSGASPQRHADDAIGAGIYLRQQVGVIPSEYGITGFCFGGGVAWMVATQDPAVGAAVPYYGINPPLVDVSSNMAPSLGIYGEEDARINAGIPDLQAALEAAGVLHQIIIYPDAGHAFFNDTGARFAPEASADAWVQTLAWFRTYLSAPVLRGK